MKKRRNEIPSVCLWYNEFVKKKLFYTLFLSNVLIIFFFWWNSSSPLFSSGLGGILIAIGRILGLLAVFFVLMQFLYMGRPAWLEREFGLDKLASIHHASGKISILFILLHPFFITNGYAISSNISYIEQSKQFLINNNELVKANIALVLFVIVVASSLYIVKKRLAYELWFYVHVTTYAAIALAFGHQAALGEDLLQNTFFRNYWYFLYGFVFINVLVFRFGKQIFSFYKHRFFIANVVKETTDTASLYISGKNIEQFKGHAGQFIILRFLTKDFWWKPHPFSLSLVPQKNNLRVTIKSVGDFTSQMPFVKKRTPVMIDGPYGIFTKKVQTKNKILFIAGGVGITPIRALIEEMGKSGKDMILLYSNTTFENILFKKELDTLSKNYRFPVFYILTQDAAYKGEKGRINKQKITRLAPDCTKRDIYLCGPPPMMKSVIAILKDIGVSPKQIHYEKFSL